MSAGADTGKARRRRRKPKSVSEVMASIHSQGTGPEMSARRWLWSHGYRYRKNDTSLPGKPDIVVSASRTAIFINGCFWHLHDGCKSYSTPHTNTEFWQSKFKRNKERDARVREELRALGWRTMVIWECQLRPEDVEKTMSEAVPWQNGTMPSPAAISAQPQSSARRTPSLAHIIPKRICEIP